MAGRMKMYRRHRLPGRLFVLVRVPSSCCCKRGSSRKAMWFIPVSGIRPPLVHDVTKRGNKKKMLTPMTFTLIHATDNSRLKTCWPCFGPTEDD